MMILLIPLINKKARLLYTNIAEVMRKLPISQV